MPNSILWIGLVVLWLFWLVPMLATRHPRVRGISDTALSTRVLHRGGDEIGEGASGRAQPGDRPEEDMDPQDEQWEPEFVPDRRGRGGFDPEADALARAARYRFRQRAALFLLVGAVIFGVMGVAAAPQAWLLSLACAGALGCYLSYLRKQVRYEEDIRRRRTTKATRTRTREPRGHAHPRRRPSGAVVLDTDDEDPAFDHLDPYRPDAVRPQSNDAGLPRVVGE